ncbi:MAG TPA: hypothetical protein DCL54_12035 [Alphaproteobacteria bacterium]|nr:hypothetical protein [Alphaproteobacteria bacterium]
MAVLNRCDTNQKSMLHDLDALFVGEGGFPKKKLTPFLKGAEALPAPATEAMAQLLRRWLTPGTKESAPIEPDLPALAPIMDAAGLQIVERQDVLDLRPIDREFLRALHIKGDHKNPRHLLEQIEGFWFVIRFSTGDAPDMVGTMFNVALLSIHPLRFMSERAGPENSIVYRSHQTLVPHFTLRARFGAGAARSTAQRSQIYRGRLLEPDRAINFVGNRTETAKMFAMEWWPPRAGPVPPHAVDAHGIVTTGNSLDGTVTGPVSACHIPYPAPVRQRISEMQPRNGDAPPNKSLSHELRQLRKELEHFIGSYSEDDILKTLRAPHQSKALGQAVALCDPEALTRALAYLHDSRTRLQNGQFGGNYQVRAFD